MDQVIQLRELVATLLRVPPEQVVDETSLARLHTSLDDPKLKLGLKRLGLPSLTVARPATFGQLQAAFDGTTLEPVKESTDSSTGASGGSLVIAGVAVKHPAEGVQVGLDVQDIESLPVADDYWVHEFYVGMFDKSEIAYAVAQSEPRIHLAGCWCAKEALRKCDANFQQVGFQLTAVAHESSGRPYLVRRVSSELVRLPHALSLSHTREVATAVVVLAPSGTASTLPLRVSSPQLPPDPDLTQPSERAKRPSLPGAILRAMTLIAIGALGATLLLHYLRL